MDTIFLIGRILLGGYFLYMAYNHLVKTSNLMGYAQMKGIPSPKAAIIASGVLLLFGGYSILMGVRTDVGLWALVAFLLPVTFTMHAFWKETGDMRMADQVQFFKNMALLGAVLMLMAIPTPWPLAWGV